MGDRARWLLLTPEGRRALLVIYSIAAVASITANWIVSGPLYALGVAIPLVLAPFWARWCLRRPWA